MPSQLRSRKRSASCSKLPFGHMRHDVFRYIRAIDFRETSEYQTSLTDAELSFHERYRRPFAFERSLPSIQLEQHQTIQFSILVQYYNQISLRIWPKESTPQGNFAVLPTEILQQIFDYLLPSDRKCINLTSLNLKGPSLSECFMSLRLGSKQMQTLVLKYWQRKQEHTAFADSPTFGLIIPKQIEWILTADRNLWDAYFTNGANCSFKWEKLCITPNCPKRVYLNIQHMPLACRRLVRKVILQCHQFDRRLPDPTIHPMADCEPVHALLCVLRNALPCTTRIEIQIFANPRPYVSWDFLQPMQNYHELIHGSTHAFVPTGEGFHLVHLLRGPSPVLLYDMWAQRMAKREFGIDIPKKLRSVWVPAGGKVRIEHGDGWVEVGRGDRIGGVVVTSPIRPV